MPKEIEFKLHIPVAAGRRLADRPWLHAMMYKPAERHRLVSVYFDTPEFALRQRGITLRVRHDGKKRLQTIKADTALGPFGRQEWEEEISGDEPDLGRARHTALDGRLDLKTLKHELTAVFATDVNRTAFPLRCDGSELELAIDHGHVRTNRRREPISEVEIELKKGNPSGVVTIARRIARNLPVSYGSKSKAERGYALSAEEKGKAVFASATNLQPGISVGDAFRLIGFSCLNHLAANQEPVRGGDFEGIHQMRVGLRRLRAAISVFKDVVQGPQCDGIKRELEWLTEQLGPARDLDVFVQKGVAPVRNSGQGRIEIALLQKELEKRRDRAVVQARQAAAGNRYRKAVLDCGFWIANGDWSVTHEAATVARRDRAAVDFAAQELSRRLKKIARKVRRLERLQPLQRHKLRIAIKKLRYATEFFSSLYRGRKAEKRRARLAKLLKTLQSALGELNDITAHGRLAREYARPRRHVSKEAQTAFAMGLVTGKEEERTASLVAKARGAGKRLVKQPLFWSSQ